MRFDSIFCLSPGCLCKTVCSKPGSVLTRLVRTTQYYRFPVRKAAGLVDVRFHDLRHTCGSWLAQAGVPQSHIAEVLGHSTLRMTKRYAHIAPATARAAVEKLEAVPRQVPTQATEEVAAL
jgi:integrase